MNGDFMFLPESIAAQSALNKSQTKSTLLKIRESKQALITDFG